MARLFQRARAAVGRCRLHGSLLKDPGNEVGYLYVA